MAALHCWGHLLPALGAALAASSAGPASARSGSGRDKDKGKGGHHQDVLMDAFPGGCVRYRGARAVQRGGCGTEGWVRCRTSGVGAATPPLFLRPELVGSAVQSPSCPSKQRHTEPSPSPSIVVHSSPPSPSGAGEGLTIDAVSGMLWNMSGPVLTNLVRGQGGGNEVMGGEGAHQACQVQC